MLSSVTPRIATSDDDPPMQHIPSSKITVLMDSNELDDITPPSQLVQDVSSLSEQKETSSAVAGVEFEKNEEIGFKPAPLHPSQIQSPSGGNRSKHAKVHVADE